MNENPILKLRVAYSDVFEWSVFNARNQMSKNSWREYTKKVRELKSLLDQLGNENIENLPKNSRKSLNAILDNLEKSGSGYGK